VEPALDDVAIHALVVRLSRPHASGGRVIERAAILAEGGDADAVIDWIVGRDGRGEHAAAERARGLHGGRIGGPGRTGGAPLRYVLPAGVLD
jgi:hypothetical protein